MKYFKISIKFRYEDTDNVISGANGEYVPNRELYFEKIGDGEVLENTPIFDYFYLMSTDWKRPKRWEWKLNDAHNCYGVYPVGIHWFISEKFKKILDGFNMAKPYKFYASKLLYKGEKLDYYIMQIAGHFTENINLDKSVFSVCKKELGKFNLIQTYTEKIISKNQFDSVEEHLYRNGKLCLYPKKIVFNEPKDFIFFIGMNNQYLVSERLRTAIEEAGITGVEFSESDIEFEIG